MPYKFNQSRRDKIKKSRYKVTNWSQYNEALRQRADVTVWFSPEAIAAWNAEGGGTRGRPRLYSDVAIETALLVRQVFRLPLRQTEGFLRSVVRLLALPLSIPDFSSLSRRGIGLGPELLAKALQPVSKVINWLRVFKAIDLFEERFRTIERVFAWEDKFRRLLLRFERISELHYAFKSLAYTMINLRHFCRR